MRNATVLLALATIAGCTTDAPTTTTPSTASDVSAEATIPPSETPADSTDEPIVIDVRSKSEWDTGHVGRAVHIPHTEIAERISEVTTDKEGRIVVYCAAGGRAGKAKKALEDLGFTCVENGGGYDDVRGRF